MKTARSYPLLLLLSLCPPLHVQGLTIYRIGGADQPPPTLDVPYEFAHVSWSEITASGQTQSLHVQAEYIEPKQLEASVNLIPSLVENGGLILTTGGYDGLVAPGESELVSWDGDIETAYQGDETVSWRGIFNRRENRSDRPFKYWVFDLGGRFTIQKIRFHPRDRFRFERFAESFIVGVSDGDPSKDGNRDLKVAEELDFDEVHNIRENTNAVVELEFPRRAVRQLLFAVRRNIRSFWEIAEIEIYGTGFSAFARYESTIIDIGQPLVLGPLAWAGDQPLGTSIKVRTRLGDDPDPNLYWRTTFRGEEKTLFDRQGRLLTQETYATLQLGERAGTTHDTRNWSDWSAPIVLAAGTGRPIGDRPRRFAQVRADFHSQPESGGRLNYLQFAASQPRATHIAAEIEPTQVRPGQTTSFTYKMLPHFDGDEPGFDQVEIDTPRRAVSVDAVRIDGRDEAFAVLRLDQSGFAVQIPHIDLRRTLDLIEIDFKAQVFQYGTVFSGRVSDSTQPYEVAQAVVAGDADVQNDSATLQVVLADVGLESIGRMELDSPICTPNSDGVNDEMRLEYDLLNLAGTALVYVDLCDLSGRKLWTIDRIAHSSGRFAVAWDGRDDRGLLLPPGVYLLRLEVGTDKGKDRVSRIVSLVY